MNNIAAKSRLASGICVIVAILYSQGCAVINPEPSMPAHFLETFRIDCAKKTEQIEFLQSLRSTHNDRLAAVVSSMVRPWENLTDPNTAAERRSVSSRRNDWLIDQKLMRLKWDCGPNTPR